MATTKKRNQQLRVAEMLSVRGLTVRVRLTDSSERALHLRRYLWGPLGSQVRQDRRLFRAVRVEGGTLAWPNGWDICPDDLLETEVARCGHQAMRQAKARWTTAIATICTFGGAKILVYPHDHHPVQVRVRHGRTVTRVGVLDGKLLRGELPDAAHREVRAWLKLRQREVLDACVMAASGQDPRKVDPPRPNDRRHRQEVGAARSSPGGRVGPA